MTVSPAEEVAQRDAEIHRLRTLLKISTLMHAEMNHAKLIERINEEVRAYLHADRMTVFFYDRRTDELYSYIASGLQPGEIRIPATKGIAGYVFQSGEMVSAEDAYQDPRFNPEVDRMTGYRTRSLLCLHITNRNGVRIGVVQALNKQSEKQGEPGAFTEDDMIFLWEVMDLISDLYAAMEEAISHLIIYAVDRGGTITYASPALEVLTGYSPAEAIGQRFDRLLYAEDVEEFRKSFVRTLAGKLTSPTEFRVQTKSGELRWFRSTGQPVYEQSDITGIHGQMVDITERKMLEEQLREAQKIESIGRLAGGIAHDFNNLLVPIIGYAEVAARKLSEDDDAYHDIKQIQDAAERARDLTHQLLAFSRKQVLDMKVLNLNRVFLDFEKILRRIIGEDVEIVSKLEPTLGNVRADRSQIQQILMNLTANSRDAMPQGGTIKIETANVYLADEAATDGGVHPGPYAMLLVSDSGHGMDQETLAQIFEPFFTTKKKGKGTGLGLATVYGIVKQHNGCIRVTSEMEKGTTFTGYLPIVADRPEVAEEPVHEGPVQGGSETILLVEDEDVVRSFIGDVLRQCGYDVVEAATPEAALEEAGHEDRHVHLLLTDVIMPRMDGHELWRHLSGFHPEMKVIYMSGYVGNIPGCEDILLTSSGAFLQKPFSVQALTEKIRDVLDGKIPPVVAVAAP